MPPPLAFVGGALERTASQWEGQALQALTPGAAYVAAKAVETGTPMILRGVMAVGWGVAANAIAIASRGRRAVQVVTETALPSTWMNRLAGSVPLQVIMGALAVPYMVMSILRVFDGGADETAAEAATCEVDPFHVVSAKTDLLGELNDLLQSSIEEENKRLEDSSAPVEPVAGKRLKNGVKIGGKFGNAMERLTGKDLDGDGDVGVDQRAAQRLEEIRIKGRLDAFRATQARIDERLALEQKQMMV